MDSYLGDIGAFKSRNQNLGLVRRVGLPSVSQGEHKPQDFYWIERDQGVTTYQPSPMTAGAFSQLSPEHQTLYRNLLWFTQGDAAATNSLESLLLKQKLTPALMSALGSLVSSPLAQGIDRGQVIRETLNQLNDPMLIDQGNRSTCTAAVVQYMAIKQEPEHYVSLIAGLVSPTGSARLPNGDAVQRTGSVTTDGSGRAIVDQIVQNSLMQYATGSYNPRTDVNADGSTGLTAQRFDHLVEGVMNASYATREIDSSYSADQAIADLKKATAQGQNVPVGLQWKTGGHKILIQGFKDGLVYYFNPWGRMESMSEAELKSRIHNLSFR